MIRFEELLTRMSQMKDVFIPMSDEQFHQVQQTGLDMLLAIQKFCRESNITMMLGFGSVLGAMRHKGFIPWDDDIDILMPRKDYERFLSICEAGLPSHLKVYSPFTSPGPDVRYTKVFDEEHQITALGGAVSNKVCIDIFPLENYDTCRLRRELKWSVYLLLSTAATTSRLWADRRKDTDYKFIMKLTKKGTIEYYIRLAIGFCFSFLSYKRWLKIADRWLATQKDTGKVFIPSIFINTNPINKDIMLPVAEGEFNGHKVFLPHKVESYLEFQYGNWRKLPPEEKRRQHLFFRKPLKQDVK